MCTYTACPKIKIRLQKKKKIPSKSLSRLLLLNLKRGIPKAIQTKSLFGLKKNKKLLYGKASAYTINF